MPLHPSVWETIADALFWLQLCWVFSGFLLMAYLAFRVFPRSPERPQVDTKSSVRQSCLIGDQTTHTATTDSENGRNKLIVAGNYRLESFPDVKTPAKVIRFRSTISEQNRRLS
jgi:hypothetical protein